MMSYEDYLLKFYGYNIFRPYQRSIIEAIIEKRQDVLCIIATGYGKSLCFQLPALITNRPCIIVSPLLSLMEDQKVNLQKRSINVCCYNSTLNSYSFTQMEILAGMYNIIYITPEAIVNAQEWLTKLNDKYGIALIAIDECHCVSLWGNTFRQSYLQLSCLKTWFPTVPLLALTGTATPKVEADIVQILN